MEEVEVLKILLGNEYPTAEDLRYRRETGTLYTKKELSEFLAIKKVFFENGENHFYKLKLKAMPPLCYVEGRYLLNLLQDYFTLLSNDFSEHGKPIFARHKEEIVLGRIFSEIEGTLGIENVSTTRTKIERIRKSKTLTDRNDIIVKNMLNAMEYVLSGPPAFNKENLRRLYGLLSEDCLDKEDCLKEGAYYRDAPVYVGAYEGAPVSEIENMMDSLFSFVEEGMRTWKRKEKILLPMIAHYYILYVHPYFDYNGRTARMVSLWINELCDIVGVPPFISEAINEKKQEYYRAIINTRECDNDLTYFLGYIFETAIEYSFVYKNVEAISRILEKQGDFLTPREVWYLKKIVIHGSDGYFNVKRFAEFTHTEVSRQAISKILSAFVTYGVLEKTYNKKKETIYRLKPELLAYKI